LGLFFTIQVPKEPFFCEERLRTVLNDNIGADARTLIEAVKTEVYAFTGNTHPPDDFTILALRYSGRE